MKAAVLGLVRLGAVAVLAMWLDMPVRRLRPQRQPGGRGRDELESDR